MENVVNFAEKLATDFSVSVAQIKELSNAFYEDMCAKKTLQMLNTYMFFNATAKDGKYLAIDFGGSNIRVNFCELTSGTVNMLKSELIKLRTEEHDYTTSEYTLGDIFDICAKKILNMNIGSDEILLGHTFSFAAKSESKNTAKILYMAKGFELKNVEGQNVNAVLRESLIKYGLDNVRPVCIINDTTATLLYGRYMYPDADIACIVGTGHNTCYRKKDGEIINLESGSFSSPVIPVTDYEAELIKQVPNESIYLMEILVGGKNICNLANIAVADAIDKGIINPISNLTIKMLDQVIDNPIDTLDSNQNYFVKNLACAIYKKKADLVVSEIVGILKDIDPELRQSHTVIFDGSVYKYNSYFREQIKETLALIYEEKAGLIKTVLVEDASAKGAIVACAI